MTPHPVTDRYPPASAQALLSLFVPAATRDSVLGDLLEDYRETQVPALGIRGADVWYLRQTFGFVWRQCAPWGALVACVMVGRDVFDASVPTLDFRLRAAVTTYACISAFALAGVYAGWRSRRVMAGTVTGLVAGALACVVAGVYAFGAALAAGPLLAGNPAAAAALIEATDVPFVPIMVLGPLAGAIGAGIGKTARIFHPSSLIRNP